MRVGVCVGASGAAPLRRIRALGATAASFHLGRSGDPFADARRLRAAGLAVMAVLGPAMTEGGTDGPDGPDWRPAAHGALGAAADLADEGLIQALALGYEPDDGWDGEPASDDPLVAPRGGVGSLVMSRADLAELVHLARRRLGRRVPLLLGGLVSGHAAWLAGLDLSQVDGVLVHPHGCDDPGAYLDAVHAEIAAQGQAGRVRVAVGELGRSDLDLRRGAVADWYAATLPMLAARGDVSACFVCCDSDLTLDGYGLFDAEDRAKPAVASVFEAVRRLDGAGGPLMGDPDEDPDEATDGTTDEAEPLPWPRALPLDAEAMATALGRGGTERWIRALRAAIAVVWPELGPHLELYGVADDTAAGVALAATIWARTHGAFRPISEASVYDRCERLYGRGTPAGEVLGNRRHGDGHRFRAGGLVPIRGRAAYERYGEALGIDLAADPDLMDEPPIAAAVLAAAFEAHGLWDAARRCDYAAIAATFDGGANGHRAYVDAAQRLWSAVDAAAGAPEDGDGAAQLAAYERATELIGRPHRPGDFDAGGLVARAYAPATDGALPTDPDEIYGWTIPIDSVDARPGDIVLYAYGEPSRGGAAFAHVGLVTERDDLVLDSRVGSGVGRRPHIRGAVRRYRRVIATVGARASTEGDDEAMWRERYEELAARAGGLGASLPPAPPRPTVKAPKPEHVEYGRRMAAWAAQVERIVGELAPADEHQEQQEGEG